jgi:hypothetical protein
MRCGYRTIGNQICLEVSRRLRLSSYGCQQRKTYDRHGKSVGEPHCFKSPVMWCEESDSNNELARSIPAKRTLTNNSRDEAGRQHTKLQSYFVRELVRVTRGF